VAGLDGGSECHNEGGRQGLKSKYGIVSVRFEGVGATAGRTRQYDNVFVWRQRLILAVVCGHGTVLVANIEIWEMPCRVQKACMSLGLVKETVAHPHREDVIYLHSERCDVFWVSHLCVRDYRSSSSSRCIVDTQTVPEFLCIAKLANSASVLSPTQMGDK
jgi:hypothetical protein